MQAETWRRILSDWKQRIASYQTGQYNQATYLEKRHYQLGIPAVVLAAIAGTTVFANLSKDFSTAARLTVAIISITTAILTALQTFLNYGKRAETYRAISHQFGTLRREIDVLEQFPPSTDDQMRDKLNEFNKRIADITKDAPLIELLPEGSSGGPGGWTNALPAPPGL